MGDEDGFFPKNSSPYFAAILVGIVLVVALVMITRPDRVPPSPPFERFLGCYTSADAPAILFDREAATILAAQPIRLNSRLIYVKGWTFEIDRSLSFDRNPAGSIALKVTGTNGEYLSLVREGEFASQVPQFQVSDPDSLTAITYERVGDSCNTAAMK